MLIVRRDFQTHDAMVRFRSREYNRKDFRLRFDDVARSNGRRPAQIIDAQTKERRTTERVRVHQKSHDQSGSMPTARNYSAKGTARSCLETRVHILRVIAPSELDDIRFAHCNLRGSVDFANSEILKIA